MNTPILDTLLQLQQLFHNNELGSWARRTQRTIDLLQENQYDHDLVIDSYIGSGMDSIEFVEVGNGQVEEFERLRTILADQNNLLKVERNIQP